MINGRVPEMQLFIKKGSTVMAKYLCNVCGVEFESDEEEPVCPVCGVSGDDIVKLEDEAE